MGMDVIVGNYSRARWLDLSVDRERVLTRKIVGNEAYLAMRTRDGEGVYAVVVLFHSTHDGIGGSMMSEESGPYAYRCPIEILKMLTPTTNRFALEWRAKNWERYGVHMDWKSMLKPDDRRRVALQEIEDNLRSMRDPDLIVSAIAEGDTVKVTTADNKTHYVTKESYERLFSHSGERLTLLSDCVKVSVDAAA